tara:strand:- start:551 stop:811 length:261 start_codon:yes stop_codon:yes gene_type:complete
MAVIGILKAIKPPIIPPNVKAIVKNIRLINKIFTERIETTIASIIPLIPKKFPILEVSGEDKPLRASINRMPVIKNKIEERFADII